MTTPCCDIHSLLSKNAMILFSTMFLGQMYTTRDKSYLCWDKYCPRRLSRLNGKKKKYFTQKLPGKRKYLGS
jgi:hypothetical protein